MVTIIEYYANLCFKNKNTTVTLADTRDVLVITDEIRFALLNVEKHWVKMAQ